MDKTLSISFGQSSDAGRKPLNQDFHGIYTPRNALLNSKGIAVAIADGISSSNVSQVASETAVSSFLEDYYCTSDAWSVKKSAQTVLWSINSWLFAQTRNSPYRFNKDKGYICTFSALVLKSNTAHIFHTGDTRIYRRDQKRLEPLTEDHRHVISEDSSYLTRALGIHDYLEMDYQSITVNLQDIFILATDGVYEYVSEKEICASIDRHASDLNQAATELLQTALENGSGDNLTLQIVRIDSLPDQEVKEVQDQLLSLQPPPSLQARMTLDGYDIIREIYISSRSHVYLARDPDTEKDVVIKTPSAELRNDADYLESLLMEDWIANRLDNPHVLKAIPSKGKRKYLYTVTEYIPGKTLSQWMLDNPEPDLESVRQIIEQIAKGLQAFHRQEMIHQDLRPQNVIIDNTGNVKIIDFGATKVAGISDIRPSNDGIVGTMQYSAPEYFLGTAITQQVDIFSLGVMAYQMLSGNLPYGTRVSMCRNKAALNKLRYQALRHSNTNIPPWIDGAIHKAVQLSPLKRYGELSEFVYDLRHPNKSFLHKTRPPLVERNPVLFWQSLSLVLFLLLIWQMLSK